MPTSNLRDDLVRQALNHLSDVSELAKCPLWAILGERDAVLTGQDLQDLLIESIEAFRQAGSITEEPRAYRILYDRYVRGETQYVVAQKLGITTRHLRREQADAIAGLTEYLTLVLELDETIVGHQLTDTVQAAARIQLDQEMSWLVEHQKDQTCDLVDALREAISLAEELDDEQKVSLRLTMVHDQIQVAMPHTVTKQVFLTLLGCLVSSLSGERMIRLAVRKTDQQAIATILDRWCGNKDAEITAAVTISRRLVEAFGGTLDDIKRGDLRVFRIALPCVQHSTRVLAIDDNLDTLELWTRYLDRTRFHLVVESDPQRAIARIETLRPDIIVMDVMLQGDDGWKVLSKLRSHPQTSSIPVVICTVLPQRDLAMSMGAKGFVQKPTTGREFRSVLEQLSSCQQDL